MAYTIEQLDAYLQARDRNPDGSYCAESAELANQLRDALLTIDRVNSVIDNMDKCLPVIKDGVRSSGGVCCRNARVDMLVAWREQLRIAVASDE